MTVVEKTAARIGVPLSVGGGVRNLEDIAGLLAAGASRVSLNSAAVKDPSLVREAAERFGTEKIVVAIDTRKSPRLSSGFEVVVAGGTKPTGKDAVAWAKEVEKLGAGSLLPTSMDADGTQAGYDLPMTRAIADAVKIPVIASGGAGTLEHLRQAISEGHAEAVLVASIAHFGTFTIREMKEYLRSQGIPVRL